MVTSIIKISNTTYKLFINVTGTPSGVETIEFRPVASAVFDISGNQAPATTSTGIIKLNDKRSGDNNLSDIILSKGNLVPAFLSSITDYQASVNEADGNAGIAIQTPTTDPTATVYISINNGPYISNISSPNKVMSNEVNIVKIKVSAQNGAEKIYNVDIFKGVIFVATTGLDANTGEIDAPKKSIQSALSIVNPAFVKSIRVASGTYKPSNGGLNVVGSSYNYAGVNVNIGSIKISGGWDSNNFKVKSGVTTLDGEYLLDHIIWIGTDLLGFDDVTIDGFTITNGLADYAYPHSYGGGVYINKGKNNQIINCTITNCQSSEYGGGLYISGGFNHIINSDINNNLSQSYGGGIFIHLGTNIIVGGTIMSNTAQRNGAGIYANQSYGTKYNAVISGNTASGYLADGYGLGSGIYLENCMNSVIKGEITVNLNPNNDSGGGVYFLDTILNITNSFNYPTINGHSSYGVARTNFQSDPAGMETITWTQIPLSNTPDNCSWATFP